MLLLVSEIGCPKIEVDGAVDVADVLEATSILLKFVYFILDASFL